MAQSNQKAIKHDKEDGFTMRGLIQTSRLLLQYMHSIPSWNN